MASYRQRHREPVAEEPAASPPKVEEATSPVEQAEQQVVQERLAEHEAYPLKNRIAELERAEQGQQRFATEPQQPQPQLPESVQQWLKAHPEFISNRRNNLRLQLAHEE